MYDDPDYFGWFVAKIKDAWETEYLSPNSELKKNKFNFEEKSNCFYIYMWNSKDVVARFEPTRCWMDSPRLSSILTRILPEFTPYFQGKKNFVSGEWIIE